MPAVNEHAEREVDQKIVAGFKNIHYFLRLEIDRPIVIFWLFCYKMIKE